MGSTPGGGSGKQPANQGPPISQLNPAQGAPFYQSFINGGDYQTGLTPEMLAGISGSATPASPAASPAASTAVAATPAAAMTTTPSGAVGAQGRAIGAPSGDPQRQQLAEMLMRMQQTPEMGYNPSRGGGGGYGGRSSQSFGGRAAGGRGGLY